ncbi:MAG: hypothetical protein N3B18_11535 [Desulfobacterota bacterium]|nr:hypothetical protein [Thermodesulfobacteriota bacterium]
MNKGLVRKKNVVISFEGDKVNIIYAVKVADAFVVEDALTVSDTTFDAYLEKEPARNFTVVNSFTQFFSDIFTLPPAPDNLLKSLIEHEIRKVAKLNDFAFIYTILGEKIVEQKKVKEVFVYAVAMEHIQKIVERFIAYGKVIDALYPDVFAVAGFVGGGKETVLGVLETETNKHLFIVKEGKILFVRVVQAFDMGMRDHDMQHINMTVNYCRQNLRLNPQRIVLVGHLCRNFFVRTNIGVPMVSFTHPIFRQHIRGQRRAVDYMLPIAALFIGKQADIDLLPPQDKRLFQIDKVLRFCVVCFMFFVLGTLVQGNFIIKSIIDARKDFTALRSNLPNLGNVLSQYTAERSEFDIYRPLFESLRRNAQLPDLFAFLQQLAGIFRGAVMMKSITATAQEKSDAIGGLDITIQGIMRVEDLVQMQRQYHQMIATVKNMPGFTLIDQSLDLKTRQWNLRGTIQ